LRGATSDVADFTSGKFEPVLDDTRVANKSAVRRVVLHAGKIHYDLATEVEKRELTDIALVRLEQYYPLPLQELDAVLAQYPNAEYLWAQEEPENQGAWPFVSLELSRRLGGRRISVASRPAAASPATGSTKRSAQQQVDLIDRALTIGG
ncbi:MAG TPA: multifunctional oxoglutarate decarboxylase/oxoglutarate dehydrogenase thiamine pyrophosphate-binding subunit/dihydrolipoyllysine-residue succinyltransferase subunit, partial [Marisediminicola sp.]|nr:multifunctional oxoglutarate decarboxylase/oxoglutarate dehydrogenase thiamine pyrophosphate-binding subunit/dihydrolipoyllysine-residue succinyltransferase subunit [Marisediminicola sp.]